MSRKVASEATKAAVLRRADEIGVTAAAKEAGISLGTVKSWRSRAGQVGPPKGANPADWAELKATDAAAARDMAEKFRRAASAAEKRGDSLAANRYSISYGIYTQRGNELGEAAGRAAERAVRLSEAQGQMIAEAIRMVLTAIDVPDDLPGVRGVLRHVISLGSKGKALEPGPHAVAARREVRDGLRAEVRAEVEAEMQARPARETLALPAGPPPHPDGEDAELPDEPEPLARPVRRAVRRVAVDTTAIEVLDSVNMRLASPSGWRSQTPFGG